MPLFVILVALLVLVAFLACSASLYWLMKWLKVERTTYTNASKVLVWSKLADIIFTIVFAIMNLGIFSFLLVNISSYFAFLYVFRKYYQGTWQKVLGLYIVYQIVFTVVTVGIVLPIRYFVVQPFYVSGQTMEPTFHNGDYLLINELSRNFIRGDIIVFRYPRDPKQFFIKRIIGIPGDVVDMHNSTVSTNGKALHEDYTQGQTLGDSSLTLGKDEFYVLGDNRENSLDSRIFGALQRGAIIGKYWLRVASFKK